MEFDCNVLVLIIAFHLSCMDSASHFAHTLFLLHSSFTVGNILMKL